MTLLLYAVAEDGAARDLPGEGIAGRPVRQVSHEGLAAFVSERPDTLESTESTLLEYEEAIEYLTALMPLLPARFGTVLDGDDAVARLLAERQREFREALRRVRGSVELGLRGEWVGRADAGHPTGPGAGTDYMQGLLAARRRAQELAREVDLTFAGLTRASRPGALTDAGAAFSASYLVAEADVDEFVRRLEGLESAHEDVAFVCTGPWPPYSFANGDER